MQLNSRLQMFFSIDVLKIFAIFTGKNLRWSLFLIKLQAFRCFPMKIEKLFRENFFIEHLRGCFCRFSAVPWSLNRISTLYFQKYVVECIVVLHRIIESFWNLNLLSFASIRCTTRCLPLSFIVTLCHSLSLFVIRCHSMYHSPVSLQTVLKARSIFFKYA